MIKCIILSLFLTKFKFTENTKPDIVLDSLLDSDDEIETIVYWDNNNKIHEKICNDLVNILHHLTIKNIDKINDMYRELVNYYYDEEECMKSNFFKCHEYFRRMIIKAENEELTEGFDFSKLKNLLQELIKPMGLTPITLIFYDVNKIKELDYIPHKQIADEIANIKEKPCVGMFFEFKINSDESTCKFTLVTFKNRDLDNGSVAEGRNDQ